MIKEGGQMKIKRQENIEKRGRRKNRESAAKEYINEICNKREKRKRMKHKMSG